MPLGLRRTWFRSSFQTKLFLIFTLLTALISLLFTAFYIAIEIREERQHLATGVRLLAHHLADSVRLPLYAENTELLQQLAEDVVRLPEMRSVQIRAADGRVLTDVRSSGFAGSTTEFTETVEVRTALGLSPETAFMDGKGPSSGTLVGMVRLERSGGDLLRKTTQVITLALISAIVFWLAVSILSYLVLRQVTRSFRALVHGVQVMQGGDYGRRIEILSDDEPARAARAINELAESLMQRESENRRLNENLVKAMQFEVQSKDVLSEVNKCLQAQIADRIKAEQAVRESEQTLKNLLDFMPVGVAWTDAGGRIEYLNNFFTERFGYRVNEIPTIADWFELAFPDEEYRLEMTRNHATMYSRIKSGELDVPMQEARITCKDGAVRHILLKTKIFNDRHIIVFIDITDRELFHEQLVKTQKLESLGILAGGIAHNFNNVLTGVLGYISYARKFLDESHKSVEPLLQAEKASRRAAGMAKQLLTFARGNAPVKKTVSLRKLIDESVGLTITGTNVRCNVEMPDSIRAVKADEGQLSQAFNNIIINGVQAMNGAGTISIRAENVAIAGAGHDPAQTVDYVKLSFSDEGPGIPGDDLNKIFDPYFTTKPSGTGLGLASVHSIIYKHGGQISVESVVGKGTTFTIMLPALAEPKEERVREPHLRYRPGNGSLLVMDDTEVIRGFAKETLEYLGYEVTLCRTGEEAIRLYRDAHDAGTPFTAAILDISTVSGAGGIQVAEQILACDPHARLIVSSQYSYDPLMTEYRNHGFCAAVTKPYQADQISHELSLLLQ